MGVDAQRDRRSRVTKLKTTRREYSFPMRARALVQGFSLPSGGGCNLSVVAP